MAQWRSLPADLDPRARDLVVRLRELKDQLGLSVEALGRKTPYSKSTWGRYLNGTTFPPRQAVEALGRLAGADPARLLALWELAAAEVPGRDVAEHAGAGQDRSGRVAGAEPPGGSGPHDPVPAPDRSGPGRRRQWWTAAVAVLVAIVGVGTWLLLGSSAGQARVPAPTAGYDCDFASHDGRLYAGHSATSDRLVALNSAGADVVEVQCLLTHRGLDPGRIDGLFGKHTEQAVKELQHAAGEVDDGIVGPHTWTLLRS